ncbi:MAG: hypothetical protein WEB30_09735 [Cyclobacteriaceae bacterium]
MKIYMRMLWEFDITEEARFMELEKKFVELETRRPDYPKGGKRLQPISGLSPCNSITWEKEFDSLEEAYAMVQFFRGDEEHEKLAELQRPLFKNFRIEFYKILEF